MIYEWNKLSVIIDSTVSNESIDNPFSTNSLTSLLFAKSANELTIGGCITGAKM